MHVSRTALALAGAMTMSCGSSAAPPLTGQWGGDRAQLTLELSGGRIEYDCGAGTIEAPLVLDAKGNFSVPGKHEDYQPGPTAADAVLALRAALYRGSVAGDRMSLTVQVTGDKRPRTITLVRGQRVKLVRCL